MVKRVVRYPMDVQRNRGAWKEEYDVRLSLPQCLSAEPEFDAGVKGGSPRCVLDASKLRVYQTDIRAMCGYKK